VQVGAAHPAGAHPDPHLARTGLGHRPLDRPQRSTVDRAGMFHHPRTHATTLPGADNRRHRRRDRLPDHYAGVLDSSGRTAGARRGIRGVPSSTPPTITAAATSSTPLGRSPSTSAASPMPTTGTSNE
jgi:hypothetical protein